MGVKKESTANETLNESSVNGSAASYEELVKLVTPIAKPLATRKLTKKIYKCIKKAKGDKKNLQYGIKQVQKLLRSNTSGMVILAGDVQPVETICHLPIVCEDKNIPYCYVPSQKELGAVASKQYMSCAFVMRDDKYESTFDECISGIKKLPSVH